VYEWFVFKEIFTLLPKYLIPIILGERLLKALLKLGLQIVTVLLDQVFDHLI
jgi:hypothetical protein